MARGLRRGAAPIPVELDIQQGRYINLDALEWSSPSRERDIDKWYLYRGVSVISAARHADPTVRKFHEENAVIFTEELEAARYEKYQQEVAVLNELPPERLCVNSFCKSALLEEFLLRSITCHL